MIIFIYLLSHVFSDSPPHCYMGAAPYLIALISVILTAGVVPAGQMIFLLLQATVPCTYGVIGNSEDPCFTFGKSLP